MPIPFATDEWVQALKEEVNKSKGYREAAKNWEGDFCFVIDHLPGSAAPATLYMDLWHGECRDAFQANKPLAKEPDFVIEATVQNWRKVLEKKVDPIQAIIMRQLKLKGNMMKVVKAPKAAMELVQCCTRIPTQWP